MDRPPSYSTRSQHNTRKILNKQLSKENMYSTSPNMRSLKTTTFRTQYSQCSLRNDQVHQDKYHKNVQNLMKKKSQEGRIQQNLSYCSSEKNKYSKQTFDQTNFFTLTNRKTFNHKAIKSPSKDNRSTHINQIKQVVGYLIDKLMCNEIVNNQFRNKSPLSKLKTQQTEPSFDFQQLICSQQHDIIKDRQIQLRTAQNKTNNLVEQLSNVKDLWQKANCLRTELIKYESSLKNANRSNINSPIKFQDCQQSLKQQSYKQLLLGELQKLIKSVQIMQSKKNQKQLKQFESNIVQHMIQLKLKMEKLQSSNNNHENMNIKCQELQQIILTLENRNNELEVDNVKILEQNEKIHKKICQLQQFYQIKTIQLEKKVEELQKLHDIPNELEEQIQNYQVEIQNLKLDVANIQEQKQNAILQMDLMRNTIEILQGQKLELSEMVQKYQIRQHQNCLANAEIISQLKDKLFSLERQFHLMQQSYKKTGHTSVNPSQQQINQTQDNNNILQQGIKQSIVIKKQDLESSLLQMSELRKAKDQLQQELKSYKQMLNQKQKQQQTFIQSTLKESKSQDELLQDIKNVMLTYLNKYSNYDENQKQKLLDFMEKALKSKQQSLPILNKNSVVNSVEQNSIEQQIAEEYEEQQIMNLSQRSFENNEYDDERQPTFMEVFSKFDERQESIFRIIDTIGSNLRSGDILTQFVHEFIMKVMPNKDYEDYQRITQQFVFKIKQYQQKRVTTVDKSLTDFIVNTQMIFKQKDEIEAFLDESSSDEDEQDKFLWQDILNPTKNQPIKMVVKKSRVPHHKIMTINRKYSDKNKNVQPLAIIPQQTHKKKRSVLFEQQSAENETPPKKKSILTNKHD